MSEEQKIQLYPIPSIFKLKYTPEHFDLNDFPSLNAIFNTKTKPYTKKPENALYTW